MSNRTWIVRDGHTGNGPSLFCVYSPTMDAARDAAQRALGANYAPGFTVHGVRKGQTLPEQETLAGNPHARVPAPDYSPEPDPAQRLIETAQRQWEHERDLARQVGWL